MKAKLQISTHQSVLHSLRWTVTPAQMRNGSKWKRPTFSFNHLHSGPYHDNTCYLQQKKEYKT